MSSIKVFFVALIIVGVTALGFYLRRDDDPPDTWEWLRPDTAEYDLILADAVAHISCLSDFRRIFPRSAVYISPSFPKSRHTDVTARTIVYGRYYVQFSQRIRTDRLKLSAIPSAAPEFWIFEIEQLDYSASGGWFTRFGSNELSFGIRGWRRLRDANGDLGAVLANPIKNKPLPRAEQYLAEFDN